MIPLTVSKALVVVAPVLASMKLMQASLLFQLPLLRMKIPLPEIGEISSFFSLLQLAAMLAITNSKTLNLIKLRIFIKVFG